MSAALHVEELAGLLLAALAVLGAIAYARRRRQRELAGKTALQQSVAQGQHIPATLHPVIDPDLCIGSLSCLTACPEGDILGVVDGRAALINASACIGHGKCALECPVDAIKLVFGTAERGVELPEVDEFFESSRKGVYVVGELGGMGLIKNALIQGTQCGVQLGKTLSPRGGHGTDVAIVGAGPAGLATALACKQAGLSFRLLEQGQVGGMVAHYPRQKVVMTERVELPLVGRFGKALISKEEMLAAWDRIIRTQALRIEQGVKVTGVEGEEGAFQVLTSAGPVAARRVVLAVGRMGTPRKLGVPGEDLPKVAYRLIDPEQYEGARVLVVGGGDSALEAAISLCERSDAKVTLSYRKADFGKCREANKRRFAELVKKRHAVAAMSTEVMEVRPDKVILQTPKGPRQLANDFVIACLGGELPTEFLKAVGVSMRRHHGTALGEPSQPPIGDAKARRGSAKAQQEQARLWRLALSLALVGAVILAVLSLVGGKYYLLSPAERLQSPLHRFLRPAGPWGHGVGIVATFFMLSNFLYALRKRWSALKGRGSIRGWLTFHQFVGFMSPLVICFHAAFQSRNALASATAGSVAVVVLTGLLGRYFYELMPTTDGRLTGLDDLRATWERLKERIDPLVEGVTDPMGARMLLATAAAPLGEASFTALLTRFPLEARRTRRQVARMRRLFPDGGHYEEFAQTLQRLVRVRAQVTFYVRLRRLMALWRVVHVAVAIALVVMIAAHVAVSLYLGYRWILS